MTNNKHDYKLGPRYDRTEKLLIQISPFEKELAMKIAKAVCKFSGTRTTMTDIFRDNLLINYYYYKDRIEKEKDMAKALGFKYDL
jgi:hypothetical protein